MTGPIENGAKVIGGIVDSFRQQPLSLALVIMNLALIGMIYYILVAVKEQRTADMAALYRNQGEILQLMTKCGGRLP